MVVNTHLTINGIEYEFNSIILKRSVGEYNATSNIKIEINNYNGDFADTFILNDDIVLYADIDTEPATTKVFSGKIENIDFLGRENSERIIIKGRDNGMVLQNRLVQPRIFKDEEVSVIVNAIIEQNTAGLTTNNVNITATILDKITFNNIPVFDALNQLADMSGFYFYVDEDNDFHFEERETTSSGLTFDNTNIWFASFKNDDRNVFNRVEVRGDRILTGQEDIFTATGGSVYNLSYKPHNLGITLSGITTPPNTLYQPGGIFNIDNPARDNIKFLVDFQARRFIMTSGTTAGDNIAPIGSVLIANYEKNAPIISIKSDSASQLAYGMREKIIQDQRISDPNEASIKALTFLGENKDAIIQGELAIKGILDITPGNTAVVNIPNHNVNNKTYKIINAEYIFNKRNNLSEQVLRIIVNKKQVNFTDVMKDALLRIKQAETSTQDESIVRVQSDIGSIGISGTWFAINRSIGSALFLHTSGHDLIEHDGALIGDMRVGSVTVSGGF